MNEGVAEGVFVAVRGRMGVTSMAAVVLAWMATNAGSATAGTPGLPFTEDFADTALRDAARTNANWSTDEQALLLGWRSRQFGAYTGPISVSAITGDGDRTSAVALGDVDGDGDLDLVAGNFNQPNRLYLNNGTADPWNGVTGSNISSDADATTAVALGDLDGDGDLDLVVGNLGQVNKIYLNDGSADPFQSAVGVPLTGDMGLTVAVVLDDVNGDGHLDIATGRISTGPNRLYLNNGTTDPFAGVVGTNISSDLRNTYDLALADMDGDGDLDVVAANASGSSRLYVNDGVGDPFDTTPGTNITNDTFDFRTVTLGDVDGDGDADVVLAGNIVVPRVYLNDGSGDPFDTLLTGKEIGTNTGLMNGANLGDIDGDGDLDLVIGKYNAFVRLYLNNGTSDPWNGVAGMNLTFQSHQDTVATALGDVDGDGDLDIVTANDGSAHNENAPNLLYRNDGSSHPWQGVSGRNIASSDLATSAVAAGDLDGDGDLDLISAGLGRRTRIFLNNGTSDPWNGVGFSEVTTDQLQTESVALGDVDGDGDLDLVTGNSSNDLNRLYLNDGVGDPFDMTTASNIGTTGTNTFTVALADMNGDGHLDLVEGNGGVNLLYLNNGTSDPFNGVTPSQITGDSATTFAIAVADVDGDGDLDVVAGNSPELNRLYLNDGAGDPFDTTVGTDVGSTATFTFGLKLGDVDRDGDVDVVAASNGGRNRLYLNDGVADPFDTAAAGIDISTDTHFSQDAVLADVDADGDLDLIVANLAQVDRLYLNNGTSNPWAGVSGVDFSPDVGQSTSLVAGDFDRNGSIDVVTGRNLQFNRFYPNAAGSVPWRDANGSNITEDMRSTYEVALGDVDGDGDLDLVAADSGTANRLYRNNRTADPWKGVSGSDVGTDIFDTHAVALGDVDGDGDLDLVAGIVDTTTKPNQLHLNDGGGDPFDTLGGSDIGTMADDTEQTEAVKLGDVDGDGDLDLVVGNFNARNRVYLNDADGDPFDTLGGIDVDATAYSTYALELADLNGDGKLDLIIANVGQADRVYLGNGTSTPFSAASSYSFGGVASSTYGLDVGDVDGDGDLDVVTANHGAANGLYLNDGVGDPFDTLGGSDIGTDMDDTYDIALADMDGDGDLDVVASNLFQPAKLYLNNGPAAPFIGVVGMPFSSSAYNAISLQVADVDRDGRMEVVTGNFAAVNRVYQPGSGFHTAHGRGTSLRVDDETEPPRAVALDTTASLPANTGIDFWLSPDGGSHWKQTRTGTCFVFPSGVTDLRYRAELTSLSPVLTPRLDALTLRIPDAAPSGGAVNDGSGADIDMQASLTTIEANWSEFVDHSGCGIMMAEWAIGTTSGGTDVQDWTQAPLLVSASNSSLSLDVSTTYYVSVRVTDWAGNRSAPVSSDGVTTPDPTPTPTITSTPTSTPTATLTTTRTQTPSITPTATPTITPTATPTITPTPTPSATLTSTETPANTASATPSTTRTDSATRTSTASPPLTATPSTTATVPTGTPLPGAVTGSHFLLALGLALGACPALLRRRRGASSERASGPSHWELGFREEHRRRSRAAIRNPRSP